MFSCSVQCKLNFPFTVENNEETSLKSEVVGLDTSKDRNDKPPPYKSIRKNKIIAKLTNNYKYDECNCLPNHVAPCSHENNCMNVLLAYECDPKQCPAKDNCQNQNFHRGERFKLQVKKTNSKGWGLFAQGEITKGKFVIEYKGEMIDASNFNERFSRALAEKQVNYYFVALGNQLFIDPTKFGNKSGFANHSCDPNTELNKWIVYSNGRGELRIGLFAVRNILPVRIHIVVII